MSDIKDESACPHLPYTHTHTQVKTHIFHLLFEADVDFIAFGQSFLELIKLLTIQGQLWLERKADKSES